MHTPFSVDIQLPVTTPHLPLSSTQQGIWLDQMLHPDSIDYNLSATFPIEGPLDLTLFTEAFKRIVQRHDTLRLRLDTRQSDASWVLSHSLCSPVTVKDLSTYVDAEKQAEQEIQAAFCQPFSMTEQLWRCQLLRVCPQRWYWQFCCHHLILDGVSIITLLMDDLAKVYKRLLEGEPLPPSPPAYLDFITEDIQYRHSSHYLRDCNFWRTYLAQSPPATILPLSPRRPSSAVLPKEPVIWQLGDDLFSRIEDMTKKHGLSVLHFFYAVLASYLFRVRHVNNVVIGIPVHNRKNAKQKQTLGMFASVIPVNVTIAPDDTFIAVMQKAASTLRRCYKHQRLPITEIKQQIKTHDQALFDVSLSLELFDGNAQLGNATVQLAKTLRGAVHPLSINIHRYRNAQCTNHAAVTIEFAFSPSVWRRHDIESLCHRFTTLLTAALARPNALIVKLPILPTTERQQLLVDFNTTHAEYPQQALIHQLFEAQVAQHPDTLAVVFEDQLLSYGALNRQANRLAHYLIDLGLRRDDRVALCVTRCLDLVVGLLAILKAGGAYVPLDPHHPAERLAYMLGDSAPVAVLTQKRLGTLLTTDLPVIFLDTPDPTLDTQPTHNPDAQALGLTAQHLAYVIYTSGSTGQPKGVMVEHRQVLNLAYGLKQVQGLTHPCRVALTASIVFDASVHGWVQLLFGHTLVIVPEAARREGRLLWQYLAEQATDVLDCTPIQLQWLLDTWQVSHPGYQPQQVLIGGEALSTSLWAQLQQIKGTRFFNLYGPTECTVAATTCLIDETQEEPNIGHPLANTHIYILDPHGQLAPIGVAGEIHIGGAGVTRGYLNRPALTAERFLPDPFSHAPDARMYKTGDLGRWLPDGHIEYLGRNDFQVKIRGFRIELGEIEAHLTAYAGVRDAVVIAREDTPGDKRLVAYLLVEAGVTLSPTLLRQQLAQRLADYMLPSAFVMLDTWPLTLNGKLDRQALPVPNQAAMIHRSDAAPIGEIEATLASIWQQLLGVERVSRLDHFFELGGHSLLAVQFITRLRQTRALDLPLKTLFTTPVLADLAESLTQSIKGEPISIPLADRQQPLPLSFAQQQLRFLAALDPAASQAYHLPVALRLTGTLDYQALSTAFTQLATRHESLRTRFVLNGIEPCQSIAAPDSGLVLDRQDLRALDAQAQEGRVSACAQQQHMTPFDLEQGPLIRAQLLQLTDDEHVLLLTQHHIITDGWSIGILMRELATLYHAARNGLHAALPALPIQYADYAVWQRARLTSPIRAEHIAFWRQQLEGAPALLTLPTDHHRPAAQSYRGAHVPLRIDPSLLTALKTVGQQHRTTLFMTLLTGWSIVLARLSGQDDLVIGTPVANRQRHELEGLIGLFVNTLALRVTLSDGLRVADLLEQVRERALVAYAHQDLPFEHVVEALQPTRSLRHSPLFQVMLALNNTPAEWLTLEGVEVSTLPLPHRTTQFDLTLSLRESTEGLIGEIEYARDLFERSTIERLIRTLMQVLNAMASDTDQPLWQLPLLPDNERQQLLTDFNATQANYPQHALIHQLFEAQAAQCPDVTAVAFEDQMLSYDELNRRANRHAHHLIALGVRPDDRVAICVERSLEMVVGLLAILKAGGAYVPLDPVYPHERLRYMLDDSAPVALLTQRRLLGILPHILPTILLDVPNESIDAQTTHNPDPQTLALNAQHLAYVIYTSGSTGQAKGVMMPHRGVVNTLYSMDQCYPMTSQDRVLQKTSIGFDVATWEVFWTLKMGATLVLAPQDAQRDPQALSALILAERITVVDFVPSLFSLFLQIEDIAVRCQSLRYISCGGEALSLDNVRQLRKHLPAVRLSNFYGPTEAAIQTTVWHCPADFQGEVIPLGRPIANTAIYILDPFGQPVPIGVVGEIHIGGAGVARGYLNRPELTAERFLADPFSKQQARMYKTGDLGRWRADGNIEYHGRNDFQVKIRGLRIELGEIEAQLAQCAGVREARVIVREDTPGDKRLVAYVQSEPGVTLAPAELRQQLTPHLADYMLPSAFVVLDTWPLTPNGKLDWRALPKPAYQQTAQHYAPPCTALQQQMCEIWQQVLGIERIGIDDDFFQSGGNSLLAIQLVHRIYQATGRTILLKAIYSHRTVRTLAALEGPSVKQAVLKPRQLLADLQPLPSLNAILITGATGFVGRYLLHALLTHSSQPIYCLLRGDSQRAARQRLKQCLIDHQLWCDHFENRINIVLGTLDQPMLGMSQANYAMLSQTVGRLYHCASYMDHLANYAEMKATNVDSVENILKLASDQRPKRIIYLSTIDIFAAQPKRIVDENDDISHEVHTQDKGYIASKWVAEGLMQQAQQRGFDVSIIRLGLTSGSQKTGRCDDKQWLTKLIKTINTLGCCFQEPIIEASVLPVDYVAQAIWTLSCLDKMAPIYHLASDQRQSFPSFVARYNATQQQPISMVPYSEFIQRLQASKRQGMSIAAEYLFADDMQTQQHTRQRLNPPVRDVGTVISSDQTLKRLSQLGLPAPEVTGEIIAQYFRSVTACDRTRVVCQALA